MNKHVKYSELQTLETIKGTSYAFAALAAEEDLEDDGSVLITDSGGNSYTVDGEGNVNENTSIDPVLDSPGENKGLNPKETSFMAHQDKIYGFDNTKIGEIWQSLEGAKNDKVTYHIKPDSTYNNVYFHSNPSSVLSVSPDRAQSANQELILTSTATGIQDISEVVVSIDSVKGETINNLKVQIYPKKRLSLKVIILHEENDDVQEVAVGAQVAPNTVCVSLGTNNFRDTRANWIKGQPQNNGDDVMDANGNITVGANGICETEALNTPLKTASIDLFHLEEVLNKKVYNQAVFEWNVVDITELTINWDLNKNQIFEIYDYSSNLKLVPGEEFEVLDSILNAPKGLFGDNKKDYFIIISDHSEPIVLNNRLKDPYGLYMGPEKYQRYAFTFGNVSSDTYLTIAHELGHSAFEFEDNTYKTRQPLNLMNHVQQSDYTKRIWLLKEQWIEIQKRGK